MAKPKDRYNMAALFARTEQPPAQAEAAPAPVEPALESTPSTAESMPPQTATPAPAPADPVIPEDAPQATPAGVAPPETAAAAPPASPQARAQAAPALPVPGAAAGQTQAFSAAQPAASALERTPPVPAAAVAVTAAPEPVIPSAPARPARSGRRQAGTPPAETPAGTLAGPPVQPIPAPAVVAAPQLDVLPADEPDDTWETSQPQPPPGRRGRPVGEQGRTVAVGIGLKEAELSELDALAQKYKISRNAVLRYAVWYFLGQHRARKVRIEIEETIERRPRFGSGK